MTEQQLIDLGFERNDVLPEESGYDKPYYFYDYDICTSKGEKTGLSFISSANDEVKDGNWSVDIFDYDFLRISDIEDLKTLITILKKVAG